MDSTQDCQGSVVSTTFEPKASSVAEARRWVTAQLKLAGRDDVTDTATLVVSELVTNVVVHAHSAADLRLVVGSRGMRIEVCDDSADLPRRKAVDADVSSGRGLGLVDAVCRRWGITRRGSGKCVWAELSPAR